MIINTPWNIGDECYAVFSKTTHEDIHCEHCNKTEHRETYTREVRRAKVLDMTITVRPDQIIYWYYCDFDGYCMNAGDKIWKTYEEAVEATGNTCKKVRSKMLED